MKAKIISIHNHGNYDEEYVLLSVLEDCDIGEFLLFDTTYTSAGKVSNKLRNSYWFPDKLVKKGNLVSLRTKTGTNTTVENNQGIIVHRFYWNLKKAVWNDDGDCAILMKVENWQNFSAKKAK